MYKNGLVAVQDRGTFGVAQFPYGPANDQLKAEFGPENVAWNKQDAAWHVHYEGPKTFESLKKFADIVAPDINRSEISRAETRTFLARTDLAEKFPGMKFGESPSGALKIEGIAQGNVGAQNAIKSAGDARWASQRFVPNTRNLPDGDGIIRPTLKTGGYWMIRMEPGKSVDANLTIAAGEIAEYQRVGTLAKAITASHDAISLEVKDNRLAMRYPADNAANDIAKAGGFQWMAPKDNPKAGAYIVDVTDANKATVQATIAKIGDQFATYVVEPTRDQPGLSKPMAANMTSVTSDADIRKFVDKAAQIFSKDELAVLRATKPGAHAEMQETPRIAALSNENFGAAKQAVTTVEAVHKQAMDQKLAVAQERLAIAQPAQAMRV